MRKWGRTILAPVSCKVPKNEPKWLDGMILKRELSVKRAADIQDLDVEAMALRVTVKNRGSNSAKD